MKAVEQYFPVVLFIMLYKVVLTFQSVDEILQFDRFTSIQPAPAWVDKNLYSKHALSDM